MRSNLNNLSLRQLKAMDEVARCQSFVEAAAHLHITPSAMSETIKALEANVGVRLFDRTTRSVQLTAAGSAFLEMVRSALAQMEKAVQHMAELHNLERGKVSVVGATSALACLVAPCLKAFAQQAPQVHLEMRTLLSMQMEEALRSAQADFAVATLPPKTGEDIEARPLLVDRFGLVAVHDHPAVQGRSTDLRPMSIYPYVGLNTPSFIDALLSQAMPALPAPSIQVDGTGCLAAVLQQGIGVSLLPALSVYQMGLSNLKFCPLQKKYPQRTIYAIRLRNRSLAPAAQALWDLVCSNVHTLQGVEGVQLPAPARRRSGA